MKYSLFVPRPLMTGLFSAVTALFAVSASPALAANGSGAHGGDAVVCFSAESVKDKVLKILRDNEGKPAGLQVDPFNAPTLAAIESVELLDFYEARQSSIDGSVEGLFTPKTGSTMEQIVDDRIAALDRVNIALGVAYQSGDAYIPRKQFQLSTGGVAQISDSAETIILSDALLPRRRLDHGD